MNHWISNENVLAPKREITRQCYYRNKVARQIFISLSEMGNTIIVLKQTLFFAKSSALSFTLPIFYPNRLTLLNKMFVVLDFLERKLHLFQLFTHYEYFLPKVPLHRTSEGHSQVVLSQKDYHRCVVLVSMLGYTILCLVLTDKQHALIMVIWFAPYHR